MANANQGLINYYSSTRYNSIILQYAILFISSFYPLYVIIFVLLLSFLTVGTPVIASVIQLRSTT